MGNYIDKLAGINKDRWYLEEPESKSLSLSTYTFLSVDTDYCFDMVLDFEGGSTRAISSQARVSPLLDSCLLKKSYSCPNLG